MQSYNVINNRNGHCAFCKYWYDPANAAIQPRNIKAGIWDYDDKAENPCQKTGQKKRGGMTCKDFVCKV